MGLSEQSASLKRTPDLEPSEPPKWSSRLGRFFTGSAVGAVLDLAVGALLLSFGVSLLPASAAGLACAVILTYWIHLRWTFKVRGARFLSPHLVKFCASSLLTLGIRLLIISLGHALLGRAAYWQECALLGTAIGVSFCVNFLLSALWAFRLRREKTAT